MLTVMEPPKKKPKRMGRPPASPDQSRSALVTVRCRPAWRDWLNGFSEFAKEDGVTLIEDALVVYARKLGYEVVAPKR